MRADGERPQPPSTEWLAAPAIAALVLGLALALAFQAGFMGLPLGLIIGSWTWKYAFILIDRTAGGEPPPVPSLEMLNPWDEKRPLFQILILYGAAAFCYFVSLRYGTRAGGTVAAVVLFLLPASTAVLAIGDSPWSALSPRAVLGLIARLKWTYLGMLVWIACATALALAAVVYLPISLGYVIMTGTLFLTSLIWGKVLYANRFELGLETAESAALTRDIANKTLELQWNKAFDEAYTAHKLGRAAEATERALEFVVAQPDPVAVASWMRSRSAHWNDRTLPNTMTAFVIEWRCRRETPKQALREAEQWLAAGGEVVLRDPKLTQILRALATAQRNPALAEKIQLRP